MSDLEFLELVKFGNFAAVRNLLDADPNLANAIGQRGWTALHWAVENGWKDIAQLLLSHGANVSIGDEQGQSALFIAAIDQIELVPLLLDAGADINAKDERGATPLHEASFYGELPQAQSLLDLGADVNASTPEGLTPLHLAVGHVKMISLLLERGATVDCKTSEGCTPLHFAVGALIERHLLPHYLKTIEILVQHGADMTARTDENKTPLEYANEQVGHPEIAELLIQLGGKMKKDVF